MSKIWAIGAGLATPVAGAGDVLEAWYPLLLLPDAAQSKELEAAGGKRGLLSGFDLQPMLLGLLGEMVGRPEMFDVLSKMLSQPPPASSKHPTRRRVPVCCVLEGDEAIRNTSEAYLKLHLLSARLVRPNSLNLEGLFPNLPNVAWTSIGPMPPEQVHSQRLQLSAQGHELWVHSVDKFPPLTQYIVPPGVRIADSARVRLGAWLGEGTTIMHSGSINFNAGTEGIAMVEGRVAAGVVVGHNSDIGGGSSTMGRLSGGGTELVSLGEHCLIGANAGLGIALGDRCTLESGLYLTAAAKVRMLDEQGTEVRQCRASELAGHNDLVFWRNSLTGSVECRPNPKAARLNPDLHDHN